MRVDRYSAIKFRGLLPSDLAPALARWAIPPEGRLRSRRLGLGIKAEWDAELLLSSDDLIGRNGARLQSRLSADSTQYLLRFVHRDQDDSRVLWTVVFRITEYDRNGGSGALLESAVARDAPREVYLDPKVGPPRVVHDLLDTHDSAVRPRELTLPTLRARTAEDTVALVEQLVLSRERTVPVVVIARDVHGSGAVVDTDVISRRLRGIGVVASLDGSLVSEAFTRALERNGLGPQLRCFNGAIHTYGPAGNLDNEHRLWLRRSLEALPGETRTEYVGDMLARRASLDRIPPDFLYAIEDFDRDERSAKRVVRPRLDPSNIDELRRHLAAAEELLEEAEARESLAEDQRRSAARELEQAELDASTERDLRRAVQAQLERRNVGDAERAISEDLRESLRSLVRGAPTPVQSLEIVASLFPERVVVLAKARESATQGGAEFRKPKEVFELLVRLCTRYYDALQVAGDAKAKAVFTNGEYAAQGSATEMQSGACVRDRTRVYEGYELVMWAHLRAGGKGGPKDCLRIHFAWVAEEEKLVIGHCGAHLKEA